MGIASVLFPAIKEACKAKLAGDWDSEDVKNNFANLFSKDVY